MNPTDYTLISLLFWLFSIVSLLVISRKATGVSLEVDTMDAYSINPITGKKEIGQVSSIDDLAASAPRNVPNQHPARRYNGIGVGIAALAAALYLGSATPSKGAAIQWGSEGPGVEPIGMTIQNGAQLIYVGDITNYGDLNSDADNMVQVTISTTDGSDFNYDQIFFSGDAQTPVSTTSSSATFNYFLAPGDSYQFQIYMQAGQNPGYLTISAMSDGHGAFNEIDVVPNPETVGLVLAGLATIASRLRRRINTGQNSAVDSIPQHYNNSL